MTPLDHALIHQRISHAECNVTVFTAALAALFLLACAIAINSWWAYLGAFACEVLIRRSFVANAKASLKAAQQRLDQLQADSDRDRFSQ